MYDSSCTTHSVYYLRYHIPFFRIVKKMAAMIFQDFAQRHALQRERVLLDRHNPLQGQADVRLLSRYRLDRKSIIRAFPTGNALVVSSCFLFRFYLFIFPRRFPVFIL